jgi:DSF synthase
MFSEERTVTVNSWLRYGEFYLGGHIQMKPAGRSLSTATGGLLVTSTHRVAQKSDPASTESARSPLPLVKTEPLSFSEQVRFLNRTYQELLVTLDPNTKSIWCHLRPKGPPSFTPTMVRELVVLHHAIKSLRGSQGPDEEPLVRYYVQASTIPGIYNMGGDLLFLTEKIRARDRRAIQAYAYGCVEAVLEIATGFNSDVVTIGLIEGDALGGGLEGALCANFIVAERHVKMGLPEILFNAFPGMGAYSMLSRRLGVAATERMILSGHIFGAEEMYDLGAIDLVVDKGRGEQAVREYIGDPRKHATRNAIYRARQRTNPLTLAELRDITDMWVETTMKLSETDLRRMNHLQSAQIRRLRRVQELAGKRSSP